MDLRSFPRIFLHGPLILWRFTRPNCLITIELRQRLLAAAFIFVLIWYLAAPREVTAISLVTLGGLLGACLFWARAMALRVAGQRKLRYAAVQVGEELEEHLTLDNTSALPVLWAEFVDRSDLPGYMVTSVRATDAHSSIRWRARALCARHGLYSLGPWELHLGDPFGVCVVRQIYTQPQEVLVYPPLAALPEELLPHGAAVGDQRPLRQPLRAETVSATHTRPYHPGDSLHHLHWRTTARREALFTKVFEPEASSGIWLIPDLDKNAHLTPLPGLTGKGGDDTEETMMLLAASLANHLLRRRLAVGLAAYANKPIVVPPQVGTPHLWNILRALAPLQLNSPWPLARTLARAQPLISARDLVVVITPSVSADWPGELRRLIRRGGGAEAILLDPASFGGEGDAETCALILADLGITPKIVRRGEVRPIPAAYGRLRRWEFMTLGTGRVVVKQRPRVAAE